MNYYNPNYETKFKASVKVTKTYYSPNYETKVTDILAAF